ncbi:MAG: copper resistance protein CopC [Thaumarchaeota archaeon]|nr:copper resistance protein CopC [Nitrososphaerota archaeon]
MKILENRNTEKLSKDEIVIRQFGYYLKKSQKQKLIIFLLIVSPLAILTISHIPNSYAHALIANSDPKPSQSLSSPPSKIDVYFTDPVDIHYSQIKVLDPTGKEIENKDEQYIKGDQTALTVTLPSGLTNGVYTVSTKVLDQTDGHVTENAFVFAVGVQAPSSPTTKAVSYSDVISIPDAVARFPAILGQVIVVGTAFSTLWLWRPVGKINGLQKIMYNVRLNTDRRASTLMLIGAVVVFASGFGMILSVAYSLNTGFADAVLTKFGQSWLIRMIFSSALLALTSILYLRQRKSNLEIPTGWTAAILVTGFAVLATTSIISHGAAIGGLPFTLDFIHNLAASIWIGGVIYIDWVLISKLKEMKDSHTPSAVLSMMIPKFSTTVLPILGAVLITGPFLLYLLESDLSLTISSIYGKILITKFVFAGIMLVVGGYHQISVHNKAKSILASMTKKETTVIRGAIAGSESIDNGHHTKSLLNKFGISAKIESAAGIALIVTIALLVNSGLPATEFQDQIIQKSSAFALSLPDHSTTVFSDTRFVDNGNRITVAIDPYYVGSNNIKISFLDNQGKPLDTTDIFVSLNQIDRGIGPLSLNATQVSNGVFTIDTDAITIPGNWKMEVQGTPNTANALSLVATYNLIFKPQPSQMTANIQEFKIPDNSTMPLVPIYDKQRNVVWFGDSKIGSGRLFDFNLDSKKFTEHKINNVNLITSIVLDNKNTIWYIDPINKTLGNFDPSDNSNKLYTLPTKGILSGIAYDGTDNIWLSASSTDEVLKYNIISSKFTSIKLPAGSVPLGIYVDQVANQTWVTESGTGKIANINGSNMQLISEYPTKNQNITLASPTAIVADPLSENLFISEHDGKAITKFDPLLKTFTRYNLDQNGLPFGMVFDNNNEIWIAQHTLDKIAVVDPRTGNTNEFSIPTESSFTQYLTADADGHPILAEQRSHAIAIVTTTANPSSPVKNSQSTLPITNLGFSYSDLAAPSIMIGFIGVAYFYARSALDLQNNTNKVKQIF